MERDRLKEAWQDYIEWGIVSCVTRPVILESWIRCTNMGVDPWKKKPDRILSRAYFTEYRAAKQPLLELCVPYMETLYAFVRNSEFVISLTDETGLILKIIGDESIKTQIERGGFVEGADWSEKSVGTNGIGTAIASGQPIQVYSYEHFCRCGQISTGSCAPVYDADNNMIAVLSLVGYDYNVHSHTLGMAVAAAAAVHNSLVLLQAQQACRVSDSYKTTIMDSFPQAVLALDSEGRINHMNRYVQRLLLLEADEACIGRHFLDLLPPGNRELEEIIKNHTRCTDKEILIRTSKGDAFFGITTRLITTSPEQYDGLVLILSAIERMKKIVRRMSGAVASTTFDDLVGKNARYMETLKIAKAAAGNDFNILLLGESGTGKDVFAQAVHNHSGRKSCPFVAINCGAIPRELIGSELFGYVEGAYTGARKGGSPGKFELADTGTIFLDEIGDMPIDLQGHLLRVLEERKLTRIGGQEVIPIDVRVIAATNQNLAGKVESGQFRQDLYYRLNVLAIHMLPFRERKDDLPEMIDLFYSKLTKNLEYAKFPVPQSFIDALSAYHFPGNIRELQNIIEHCVIVSGDGKLSVDNLPPEVKLSLRMGKIRASAGHLPGKRQASAEKEEVFKALLKHEGNISKAAQELGMARSTFYRKMDRFGLVKSFTLD